ncbi:ABC transporter permease subunit [Volucribacter amazonae]|uniref:ABC transporter permease n=1 Tax=Volucribacter amazonae TaxID=256731 RepID=A0A9X4PBA1_9PAST|nr:ABC transporter permease subunit [Volucribacter amazonae]MDG6894171.1 ABC transporter permease [Volucribacter amazonae]
MDAWTILWAEREQFWTGFITTLNLFVQSAIVAFLLGIVCLFLLEGKLNPLRRLLLLAIDTMRTLPFLIYVYLLYYGLPALGITMDAWTAGLIGLITYHGAYFAEIFRGLRATLPQGQVEAALSQGFGRNKMVYLLILPQLLLRSSSLLANQFVYLLKDTAFLTIITVRELTGVAAAVQANYFIPIEAFVVAMGLYWILSLIIDYAMKLLNKSAISRGLSYEQSNIRR